MKRNNHLFTNFKFFILQQWQEFVILQAREQSLETIDLILWDQAKEPSNQILYTRWLLWKMAAE